MFLFGNISIVIIVVLSSAIRAQPHIVQFHALNLELVACEQVVVKMLVDFHVKNPAALVAHEVCMWVRVAVEVHGVLVECQPEHSLIVDKQLERVIHRGARQCWHCLHKVGVYVIRRGVGAVVKQILHDCHPLHRWSYVVPC